MFEEAELQRKSNEVQSLLDAVQPLLLDFISQARQTQGQDSVDSVNGTKSVSQFPERNALLNYTEPKLLQERMPLELPVRGKGKDGILDILQHILKYSTNTWHQGFMDKLYSSTNAVGVASELILAVLNTNVHVYKVSPALTIIEKTTTKALAAKFGLSEKNSGGIIQAGGSASNLTALVVARNTLYPETKIEGNGSRRFVVFTSVHGHYSFEKAAQICGMGSSATRAVNVDEKGRMLVSDLVHKIQQARSQGFTPLLVNGTAGTTVLGSYDPLPEIAKVCRQESLWFHVDGSWGGSVVFSDKHKHKLKGAEEADSIAVNPHKMLGVPIQCSMLLAKDLAHFQKSNTLPASYLFHASSGDKEDAETWDLADLTLQCGRKGDALKLALGWIYYGSHGYGIRIEHAFDVAGQLATIIEQHPHFMLVSEKIPPCLQVCFYYAPNGNLPSAENNSKRTADVVHRLIEKEFLIDYASESRGLFFRAVVGLETRSVTVERLVAAIFDLCR